MIQCLSEHRIRVTDFRTVLPDAGGRLSEADRPFDPRLKGRLAMLRGLWKLTWLEIKIFLREPLGAVRDRSCIPVLRFRRRWGGFAAAGSRPGSLVPRGFVASDCRSSCRC